MLTIAELRRIAKARLDDAEALLHTRRYDGAVYLCGYAVELALKARICKTLRWEGFPETVGEFRDLQSFRIHDLEALLHLSGIENRVKDQFVAQWSSVSEWDPEMRYARVGTTGRQAASVMVEHVKVLLRQL